MKISKSFSFEASHILPNHPGKCSRLHGHSWTGSITVQGKIDPKTGFVLDYAILGDILEDRVVSKLDHYHLGTPLSYMSAIDKFEATGWLSGVLDIYPSAENIVTWIAEQLQLAIEAFPGVQLVEVRLKETCTSEAIWTGPYDIQGSRIHLYEKGDV